MQWLTRRRTGWREAVFTAGMMLAWAAVMCGLFIAASLAVHGHVDWGF